MQINVTFSDLMYKVRIPVTLVISGCALLTLQVLFSDYRIHGLYFQRWSSDVLMQTLPAAILHDQPLKSLFYLHIQPPMMDSIRALIAAFWNESKGAIEPYIDTLLYRIWIPMFAVQATILFNWIFLATRSIKFASCCFVLWVLHPSPIAMATFLDSSYMSSLFITWLIYEIWLVGFRSGSVTRVVIAASLCFLTRTIFQWYFVPILLVTLVLTGVDRRRIFIAISLFALLVGGYIVKQQILFGTFSTTTFAGQHKTGLLWIAGTNPDNPGEYQKTLVKHEGVVGINYPQKGQTVAAKFNAEWQWRIHLIHTQIANEMCGANLKYCIKSVWRSVHRNWPDYWTETYSFDSNVLVDRIPWKNFYYRIVSRYQLFLFPALIIALILIVKTKQYSQWIGVSIVPIYVLGISLLGNRFDWYEGQRLKIFLEPTFFVFLATQGFFTMMAIKCWAKARYFSSTH